MKNAKIIALVLTVLSILWILSGQFKTEAPPPAPATDVKTASVNNVRIRELSAQDYPDEVIITGRSQASRSVQLKAETGGQVLVLLKEEGQQIADKDPLAELEIRDREARVREAQERVTQRQIEYNASRKLEDKGFNSKLRVSQTLADLEDAKAALKQAQVEHEKTRILAPFEGVIAEQQVEIGDYLAVGDPVFRIVDLDPVEFVGYLSERRVQEIILGSPAIAEFLNGSQMSGTISYIAPAADENTRTFRVIMSSANTNLAVKEGQTARLRIPVSKKKAHQISPSILSLNDAGIIGVKIVNQDNIVEFMPVEIIADNPSAMYVTGLPEKARVITVGQDFVMEGQSVNPVLAEGDGLL